MRQLWTSIAIVALVAMLVTVLPYVAGIVPPLRSW